MVSALKLNLAWSNEKAIHSNRIQHATGPVQVSVQKEHIAARRLSLVHLLVQAHLHRSYFNVANVQLSACRCHLQTRGQIQYVA